MSKALTAFDDLRHANGLDAHLCPEVPHDDFHPGAGIGLTVALAGWSPAAS